MSVTIAVIDWFGLRMSNEKLMLHYTKHRHYQALEKLYANCGDDLYHFLLTLSDPFIAEDIAQQTWIKVIECTHLYQPTGQFKSWLFTIARRLLIDELRRSSKLTSLNDTSPLEDTASAVGDTLLNSFNQSLSELPFEQREAFCLQQEGFSLEEIAEMTHASKETIKSRLRYARKKLATALKHRCPAGENS